ncbi:pilin, partial [Patescibacteria group bacterium]|nr:pilin [Patescibacteria group bacterium]
YFYIIILLGIFILSFNIVYAANGDECRRMNHYTCETPTPTLDACAYSDGTGDKKQTCMDEGQSDCNTGLQCCICNKWLTDKEPSPEPGNKGAVGTTKGILPPPSNPECPPGYPAGKNCGGYTLNDFVELAVNVSKFILGIVGSLCLLMFIYGGILILLSGESTITEGGKGQKINQGKDAIKNAIVGLVIVFTAYMIITFVFEALGLGKGWSSTGWFNK